MTSRDTSAVTPDSATRRLAALRREMADIIVQIDSVRADDTAIAVKATIGLPDGARHTAIAALDVDNTQSWAAQHEQVQASAITRALDGLGIADDQPQRTSPQPQEAARPQEATPPRPQPTNQSAPESRAAQPRPQPAAPAPAANQPQAAPPASPGASAVQRADGDHLSEYSWTSFWQAARARNITREQVEAALGRSIQQATPRDAVEALQAAGMWG